MCRRTFTETHGTVFYRLRNAPELITVVVTLLAQGCPLLAMVVAFGLDERTVVKWPARAGQHCESVQEHRVERPRDLGQVQADELRVKKQGGIVWLAMAVQVSTRLWLGGTLGVQRNFDLILAWGQKVRACALCRPLLICTDGFAAYLRAIRQVFREPVPTGQRGRPVLRPWDNLLIAQWGDTCTARRRACQYRLHRAPECDLSRAPGGIGPTRPLAGAPSADPVPGDVFDRHGVQLLHVSQESADPRDHRRSQVPPTHAGDGGRPHRPLLDSRRTLALSRAAALDPPKRRGRLSAATQCLITQWST